MYPARRRLEEMGSGMEQVGEHAEQLRFLLTAGRTGDALQYLNALSPYRFTALYRFDADHLHNLVLIDRDNPVPPLFDTIPVDESYCAFVQRSRQAFVLQDSRIDARVDGHPKQPVVHAYCGVPLTDAEGRLFGTLCHFDFEATEASADVLDLMERVAAYLDPALAVEATAAGIEQRLEALMAMLELIRATSPGTDDALEAFDSYADPIRDDAQVKLPQDRFAMVDRRLMQLRGVLGTVQ